MKTIVLTPSFTLESSLQTLLEEHGYTIFSDSQPLSTEHKNTTEVLITYVEDHITSAYLQQYPNCKFVLTASTGVNHIDHQYCLEHNITIFSAAGVNSSSVAEFAVCMMISLLRHIPQHITDTKMGVWNQHLGNNIAGKTIGFIGCGNIAQSIAKKLSGFDIGALLGYDPYGKQDVLAAYNITLTSLSVIYAKSDIICIQLPSTHETYHLINENAFMAMKKRPYLINVGRGDTVSTSALIAALERNSIAGAACDVFEGEPVINEILRSFPQVILTPHIASKTDETKFELAKSVIEKLLAKTI